MAWGCIVTETGDPATIRANLDIEETYHASFGGNAGENPFTVRVVSLVPALPFNTFGSRWRTALTTAVVAALDLERPGEVIARASMYLPSRQAGI